MGLPSGDAIEPKRRVSLAAEVRKGSLSARAGCQDIATAATQ